jgi:cyclopropane fatty-acyl-phospholipid synthase-like methyltransferase
MLLEGVRNWLGRAGPVPPREAAPDSSPAPIAQQRRPRPAWTRERLEITDALWGEGFQFPGGTDEALRLARPLGLSASSSLLLVGAGSGGAACGIAAGLGTWVSGFEADPGLLDAAARCCSRHNAGKRVRIEPWDPAAPRFSARHYHRSIAIEPLRKAAAEPVLAAILDALMPAGQLMLVATVAAAPLNPRDPACARWARLEGYDAVALPTDTAVTRILGRLGFDVRVAEDISQRHVHQALLGWRCAVRGMQEARPDAPTAVQVVEEAEVWLHRLRLFRAGRLKLMRWHAIAPGEPGGG